MEPTKFFLTISDNLFKICKCVVIIDEIYDQFMMYLKIIDIIDNPFSQYNIKLNDIISIWYLNLKLQCTLNDGGKLNINHNYECFLDTYYKTKEI